MGESMTKKMIPARTSAREEKVPLLRVPRDAGKSFHAILTRTAVSLARSITLYGIRNRS